MSKTKSPQNTRWSCLELTVDEPDAQGVAGFHFTLQDEHGFVYVVSTTFERGRLASDIVNAMRAAQAHIVLAAGGQMKNASLHKSH